jgi:hypothetical protein
MSSTDFEIHKWVLNSEARRCIWMILKKDEVLMRWHTGWGTGSVLFYDVMKRFCTRLIITLEEDTKCILGLAVGVRRKNSSENSED